MPPAGLQKNVVGKLSVTYSRGISPTKSTKGKEK
jgi:hypothetical protein